MTVENQKENLVNFYNRMLVQIQSDMQDIMIANDVDKYNSLYDASMMIAKKLDALKS